MNEVGKVLLVFWIKEELIVGVVFFFLLWFGGSGGWFVLFLPKADDVELSSIGKADGTANLLFGIVVESVAEFWLLLV